MQTLETKILNYMNSIAQADPDAMISLIRNRTPCNTALLTHALCQCGVDDGVATVGPLGVMCGLVEAITGKRLVAMFSDDAAAFTGFVLMQPQDVDVLRGMPSPT